MGVSSLESLVSVDTLSGLLSIEILLVVTVPTVFSETVLRFIAVSIH